MRYFLICTTILFCCNINAQKHEWAPETREIIVNQGDSIIRSKILIVNKSVKVNEECMYFWHNKGQISKNVGGFAGELLHGEYFVYDNQKRLITQGTFNNGLMEGRWKTWYTNGQLRSSKCYHNGYLDGEQKDFDINGVLVKDCTYKKGKPVTKDETKLKFKLLRKTESEADSLTVSEINK